MPCSSMNAVIPCFAADGSVFAYTIIVDAVGPFVHHILLPFSTKWSPWRVAVVLRDTTSEPLFASDMLSAPIASPACGIGRARICSGPRVTDSDAGTPACGKVRDEKGLAEIIASGNNATARH